MVATTTSQLSELEPVTGLARVRDQLAERDEISVTLQHVIRDLPRSRTFGLRRGTPRLPSLSQTELPRTERMATLASKPDMTIPLKLLGLAPFAVFVAWLAVACYALAYLISH